MRFNGSGTSTVHRLPALLAVAALAVLHGGSAPAAGGPMTGTGPQWSYQQERMIWTVAVRPGGGMVAAAGEGGQVRLLDAASGRLIRSLEGHTDTVRGVAFSPDGGTLASAAEDRTVRLWDVETGALRRTLNGHTDRIRAVAFSPDGSRLASSGEDRTVRLWDATTGALRATLMGHAGIARSVVFSPDGKRLASASGTPQKSGEVILWDPATGRPLHTLRGFADEVASVAFSRDGTLLAAAGFDQSVRLWNLPEGKAPEFRRGVDEGLPVLSVGFSPDGAILAVGTYRMEGATLLGGELRLRSLRTLQLRGELHGPPGIVLSVAFPPDGSSVLAGSGYTTPTDARPGAVHRWSLAPVREAMARRDGAPEPALQLGHRRWVVDAEFTPDGRRVASISMDSTLRIWKRETGEVERAMAGLVAYQALAVAPDGRTLAAGRLEGAVELWDLRHGDLLTTRRATAGPARALAFSPDGALLACGGGDGVVTVWDHPAGVVLRKLPPLPGAVRALAYSPDGSLLAAGSQDGAVRLWDAAGREVRSLPGHAGGTLGLAFSPTARLLASGGADRTVRLWELDTGAQRRVLEGGRDPVQSVAFSPDGNRLAAAAGETVSVRAAGEVRTWNAATGLLERAIPTGTAVASSVAFSPDGGTLAVGVGDLFTGSVALFDANQGTRVRTLEGGGSPSGVAAVSPDGRLIAAGGGTLGAGVLRLWDGETGAWLASLSGHAGQVADVRFSRDGTLLATASADASVRLWDVRTRRPVRTFSGFTGLVNTVALSPDGKLVAGGDSPLGPGAGPGSIRVWEAATGRPVRVIPAHPGGVQALAFSPRGDVLASAGEDRRIQLWSCASWEPVREFRAGAGDFLSIAFSPDGSLLAGGTLSPQSGVGEVLLWETAGGMVRRKIEGLLIPNCLSFTPDGKSLAVPAVGQEGGRAAQEVRLWNIATGSGGPSMLGHEAPSTSISFTEDGSRMVTAAGDGTVRIWLPAEARLLATLTSLPPVEQGKPIALGARPIALGARGVELPDEFLAVTPEGYYSGSASVDRYIRFRHGDALFPAESFQDRYYRPDLVRASLRGETPPPMSSFRGAAPPVAEITSPQVGNRVEGEQVQVSVQTTDDSKVERLVVLVNGARVDARPISLGARPISLGARAVAPTAHSSLQNWTLTVPVPPGAAEVRLQVVAYDDDGLRSPMADVLFARGGAAGGRGRLLGLCVGVSAYRNARLNLRFAHADAEALAAELGRQRGIYSAAEVTALTDDRATRDGIRAGLDGLIGRVTRADTVVLLLSGHGWRGGERDFYFAAHDVDPSNLPGTGLPWGDVVSRLTALSERSRRVIVLLDACHSGSAATNEDLVRAVLAANSGVMIFASSKGSEVSLEKAELGHGLFTLALLEAVRGRAAPEGEKTVTVLDFLQYVTRRVKVLSEDTQHPHIPLLQDFDPSVPIAAAE